MFWCNYNMIVKYFDHNICVYRNCDFVTTLLILKRKLGVFFVFFYMHTTWLLLEFSTN